MHNLRPNKAQARSYLLIGLITLLLGLVGLLFAIVLNINFVFFLTLIVIGGLNLLLGLRLRRWPY